MKNLLFSLNLLPLLWIFGSCGSPSMKPDQSEHLDPSSASVTSTTDSMHPASGDTLHLDTVVHPPSSTIIPPPNQNPPRTNPRNTQGPNQQKVDSLKQLKTKGKKGD